MRNSGAIDLANPLSDSPLNQGLHGCWVGLPGQDGYTLPDLCGRNHLTLTGTAAKPRPVPYFNGWGVYNDGTVASSYLKTGAIGLLNYASNPITIIAGIRPEGYSASYKETFLFVGTQNDSQPVIALNHSATGYPSYNAWAIEGYGNGAAPSLNSGVTPVDYAPTFIAFTWDGSAASAIYVDGVSKATGSTAPQSGTYDRICIGSFGTRYDAVSGTTLFARLYHRALSASQIGALYDDWRRGFPETIRRTPNRIWFLSLNASGGTFTASAAVTVGPATCSGSATFTKPTYTGTSAVTVGAATCSASGTFTKPTYTGTAAVTTGPATCSASATFTRPTYTGAGAVTAGAATCSGVATFVKPTYTGAAAVATSAATCAASGTFTKPTYTATAAVTIGHATCSGSAIHTVSYGTGTAAVTAGPATCSGSATFTRPTYTGTAAVNAPAATCSGSATSVDPDTYNYTRTVTYAGKTRRSTTTYEGKTRRGTTTYAGKTRRSTLTYGA